MPRFTALTGAVALAASLLVACSDDAAPEATPSAEAGETTTGAAAPSSAKEVWEAARQGLVAADTGTVAGSFVDYGYRYLLSGVYELSSASTTLTTRSLIPDDPFDSAWITVGDASWVTRHSSTADFGSCWFADSTTDLTQEVPADALAEYGVPSALQVLATAKVQGFADDDTRIRARASARRVISSAVPSFFDSISPKGRDFMVPIEATVLDGEFVGWEADYDEFAAAARRAGLNLKSSKDLRVKRLAPYVSVALSGLGAPVEVDPPPEASTFAFGDLAGLRDDPGCDAEIDD